MPTATVTTDDLMHIRTEHPELRIIDVRSPGEFADRHIPGSYNVPLPMLAEHQTELRAASGTPVVLVCQSGQRAAQAESQLTAAGFESVHVLDGGVQAWETASLPVVRLDPTGMPWTLERQVRLVAGGIIAAAIGASVRWPAARFLAGAVGSGLVVAALTNTCTMGTLLARLPYNRRPTRCDLPTVVSKLTGPIAEARS